MKASIYFDDIEWECVAMYVPAEDIISLDKPKEADGVVKEYFFNEEQLSLFLYHIPHNCMTAVIREMMQEAGKNIFHW